jgi:phosphatidylglycerophosphate synthase
VDGRNGKHEDFEGRYAARDLFRVPGLLSLARIPLGVLFPMVVGRSEVAVGLLVTAGVTDIADGWYARRFHEETPMGRVIDPITDKAFVMFVVGTLTAFRELSLVEALLLGTRELCEVLLFVYGTFAWRGLPRPARGANRWGKIATVMQFATVTALLVRAPQRTVWILAASVVGGVAAVSYAVREFHDIASARASTHRRDS